MIVADKACPIFSRTWASCLCLANQVCPPLTGWDKESRTPGHEDGRRTSRPMGTSAGRTPNGNGWCKYRHIIFSLIVNLEFSPCTSNFLVHRCANLWGILMLSIGILCFHSRALVPKSLQHLFMTIEFVSCHCDAVIKYYIIHCIEVVHNFLLALSNLPFYQFQFWKRQSLFRNIQ